MNYNAIHKNRLLSADLPPGQFATTHMQNGNLHPKQLEISIREYNIPVGNRFSTLVDKGGKKNEQTTLQHEQTHGITNDLHLNNTIQQQQQQYSTGNQLAERLYTKVLTIKPSVKTSEHIDLIIQILLIPNSLSLQVRIKMNAIIRLIATKAAETNHDGVVYQMSQSMKLLKLPYNPTKAQLRGRCGFTFCFNK